MQSVSKIYHYSVHKILQRIAWPVVFKSYHHQDIIRNISIGLHFGWLSVCMLLWKYFQVI